MAIPKFHDLTLPLLRLYGDGQEHSKTDVLNVLQREFGLSDVDMAERLPSGRQGRFENRVGWGKSHLTQAGLIERVGKGIHRITKRGLDVLASPPERIDVNYLRRFEEYGWFRNHVKMKEIDTPALQESTPEELLEAGYRQVRETLAIDILQQVKQGSPAFFERLVVELLVRMGYGGKREDAGQVLGKSGDGGIDGIINEDSLGLDVIYLQAKRWEGDVGRPEIQKFVGALAGHKATKGVFLTTSGYSKEARTYAGQVNAKIVLIDGPMLAELMIDHGLGVATVTSYEIKRIDSDYFAED